MKCPYCSNGPLGTPKKDMIRNTDLPNTSGKFLFYQCDGGAFTQHALIQYFPRDSTFQTKDYKIACFFVVHGYIMEKRGHTYFLTKGSGGSAFT